MNRKILVVQTGTPNTASVLAGLRRVGATPVLTENPARILGSDRVVLPGVGALGAAMKQLVSRGLDQALIERMNNNRPTLAICLGLQLLCAESDESPGIQGLNIVPNRVSEFPAEVRVPQMGWNQVQPGPQTRYLLPGRAYFANSYRLQETPPEWNVAWTQYGGPFVAAMERGDVLACQFHPELSGAWGQDLLARWCQGGASC